MFGICDVECDDLDLLLWIVVLFGVGVLVGIVWLVYVGLVLVVLWMLLVVVVKVGGGILFDLFDGGGVLLSCSLLSLCSFSLCSLSSCGGCLLS